MDNKNNKETIEKVGLPKTEVKKKRMPRKNNTTPKFEFKKEAKLFCFNFTHISSYLRCPSLTCSIFWTNCLWGC